MTRRYLPDVLFFALVAAYVVACVTSPAFWPVFVGFAIGTGIQWCMEWKAAIGAADAGIQGEHK